MDPSGSRTQRAQWDHPVAMLGVVLVDASVEPLLTGLHQRPRRLRDGVARQGLSGEHGPTADQVAGHPIPTLIVDRELAPAHLHDRWARRAVLARLRDSGSSHRCRDRTGADQIMATPAKVARRIAAARTFSRRPATGWGLPAIIVSNLRCSSSSGMNSGAGTPAPVRLSHRTSCRSIRRSGRFSGDSGR